MSAVVIPLICSSVHEISLKSWLQLLNWTVAVTGRVHLCSMHWNIDIMIQPNFYYPSHFHCSYWSAYLMDLVSKSFSLLKNVVMVNKGQLDFNFQSVVKLLLRQIRWCKPNWQFILQCNMKYLEDFVCCWLLWQPLVGHNNLMDVMFLYDKFYRPLPGIFC